MDRIRGVLIDGHIPQNGPHSGASIPADLGLSVDFKTGPNRPNSGLRWTIVHFLILGPPAAPTAATVGSAGTARPAAGVTAPADAPPPSTAVTHLWGVARPPFPLSNAPAGSRTGPAGRPRRTAGRPRGALPPVMPLTLPGGDGAAAGAPEARIFDLEQFVKNTYK